MDIAVALDQRWKGERSKSNKEEVHHHHHHRHHRKPRNRKPNHHGHENRVLNFDNKTESIPEDSVHGGSFSKSSLSSQEDSIFTEDGVLGLNLFLARWSFDAMRNPAFKNKFHQLILKKLGALRRPDFITELNVSGLELGSNFPEIKSVRSASFSTDLILPELLLDVSYSGGLEFKVEATVDLREGAVWESVDRAFNGWQGVSKSDEDDEDDFDSPEDAEGVQRRQPNSDKTPSSRRSFATRGAKFATRMVESIPKIQLGLSVKIVSLEGTLSVWVAPPPASRLWMSFVGSPKLELEANPIFGNRLMNYSAYLGRVSSWLEGKIKTSFLNNLVFPMCADLRFPGLLSLADEAGLALPTGHIMKDLNLYPESDSDEERPEGSSSKQSPPQDHLQVKETSMDDSLTNLNKIDLNPSKTTTLRQSCSDDFLPQEDQEDDPETHQLFDSTVLRKYQSLSDGDVCEDPSIEIENSKISLEQDCTVSDNGEFFDADTSTSIRPTTSSCSETESTPIQWPQQLPSSKGFQLKRRNSYKTQNDEEDSPEAAGKVTPTRGLGGWFSDIVKTVQTNVEDGEVSRRQRAMHRGNQFVKTARQKAGEQGTKIKEAIKNRTAPLRGNVMLNRDSTPARRLSFMD